MGLVASLCLGMAGAGAAEGDSELLRQFRQLQEQNQALLKQLTQQQQRIESLSRKVTALEERGGTAGVGSTDNDAGAGPRSVKPGGAGLGLTRLTGEGAVGFFHSGSDGRFPHHEFRVDEARLFLEAPLLEDIYFAGEINLVTRDEPNLDVNLRLGELYLDFENLSHWWGRNGEVNLRAGRLYIPFGEEYQQRNAIDNPLVSHSLSDLWGVDEGVELYGNVGGANYAVAVQNGGHPAWHDYTSDKSVAGRLGYDPTPWLHLSVSGMRTGDLDVAGDKLSELWQGGAFIRALGSPTNTTTFHAELFEGDVGITIPRGYIKVAGGWIHSADNSPARNTGRDVYYYYVEALQGFAKRWYGAARFSQMLAHHGYPIMGNGSFGEYFNQALTTELWRLSLGLGYRVAPGLVLKAEYSFEEGRTVGGEKRFHENLLAVEAAYKF